MMKYEIFKEVVAERFLSQMPDDFANHTVSIQSVTEVNQIVDRLELIPPGGVHSESYPTLSVNKMYEQYQRSEDLMDTLAWAAFDMAAKYKMMAKTITTMTADDLSEKVVMSLINTEQNKELLSTIPNRPFRDLSIVYHMVTGGERTPMYGSLVTNEIAKLKGMDEQALYEAAVVNTKRLFPPTTKNMNQVIRDIFVSEGMPEEIAEMMVGEMPADKMMYVISNNKGINGAVSMLYENELHTLAEHLETDLYILPSSIHEVIAVSVGMGDPNELAQMVAEINMGQVELADRLSNQVYHYDKDLRKLTMATDTPNKRLDGIVAEPSLIYETKQSR